MPDEEPLPAVEPQTPGTPGPHADPAAVFSPQGFVDAEYRTPHVLLRMTDYHLLYALYRIRERRKGPTWQEAAIPLGIGSATFMGLLTADFKDAGLSAATWQAFALLVTILMFASAAVLGVLVIHRFCKYPPLTVEEEYTQIRSEMIKETETLNQLEQRAKEQALTESEQ